MPLLRVTTLAALLASALLAGGAVAAEVRVLTAGAFKPVLAALVPAFERETGHRVVLANDTAGALVRRIEGGEAFDLVVLTPDALIALATKGRVAGEPARLARVAIGVAVRAGAPRPDIATLEGFRAALLAAPSIAYIDPTAGGSSGIYLDRLFTRLGIGEAVRGKAVLVPGGLVAERLVTGEAALALHQISEIRAVAGVDLVGPLPDAVQNETVYAGVLGAAAREPEAARALLTALRGPGAAAILVEKGMMAP